MAKKTIIYYSANRENEVFEQKVVEGILKVASDLPIISVSQKSMTFGKNICVGDVGHTYLNAFRQCLIGCEAATTPYVVMTESDCLYPAKGYFDFNPTDPNVIYSYDNVWILWKNGTDLYYRKERTHASLIYGREFLINLLKESLKGLPMWSREKIGFPFYKPEHKFESFHGDPIVNIKTGRGVNKGTRLMNVEPVKTLPRWGSGAKLKTKLFS